MPILSHGHYSVSLDDRANIGSFAHDGARLPVPLPTTHYEVNGTPVRMRTAGDGPVFRAEDHAGAAVARFVYSAAGELTVRIEPENGQKVENWSMTLTLPLEAEFHLPEYANVGRKLDRSMPLADFYDTRVTYNFVLVECGGIWIRFQSNQRCTGRLGVHIERHDAMFLLTVTWRAGKDDAGGIDRFASDVDARIGLFGSMREAMADFDRYLAEEVGVAPRMGGQRLPKWVESVPIFFEIDLMRCYGEIENDYRGVAEIARALKKNGAPPGSVIHMIGWSGAFDALYPTYLPVEELGGDAAFRQMMSTIRQLGFRTSFHVDGCAIDPSHPEIDQLLPLVIRRPDGRMRGYKTAEDITPPSRRIRYHTDEIPFRAQDGRHASAEVACVALCEAMVTLGGLAGADVPGRRITVRINGRSHTTPPGADLDAYTVPWPMMLRPGSNTVELSSTSDIDWRRGWFRVESCFTSDSVHAISTRPLLVVDTTRQEWIDRFCREMTRLVCDYGADHIYIDYTTFYHPPGAQKLFAAVYEKLPETPFSIEWCDTLEMLGWFVFSHNGATSLVKSSDKLSEISGRKHVPVTRGIIERYGWLDIPSPVCEFVKKFGNFFESSYFSFVPVNSAICIYDDRSTYADPSELHEILADAHRLNFVPMVRLNWRKYGIDPELKRYLRTFKR